VDQETVKYAQPQPGRKPTEKGIREIMKRFGWSRARAVRELMTLFEGGDVRYLRKGETFPPKAQAKERYARSGWDEQKHPRGQPENAGEFAKVPDKGNGHKLVEAPRPVEPKPAAAPEPTPAKPAETPTPTEAPKPPRRPRVARPVADVHVQPGEGTKVSSMVKYDQSVEDKRAAFEKTYKSIDSIMSDGKLAPIQVKEFLGQPGDEGVTYFKDDGSCSSLEINSFSRLTYLAIAHETGHWLDGVGVPGVNLAPHHPDRDYDHDPYFAPVFAAIEKTRMYKDLMKAKARMDVGGPVTLTNAWIHRYIDYMARKSEVWARAFGQWVGTRAHDEAIMKNVNDYRRDTQARHQPLYTAGQWSDREFAPIAKAIDGMFMKLGWIKKA
jgi:hypothetical protein